MGSQLQRNTDNVTDLQVLISLKVSKRGSLRHVQTSHFASMFSSDFNAHIVKSIFTGSGFEPTAIGSKFRAPVTRET